MFTKHAQSVIFQSGNSSGKRLLLRHPLASVISAAVCGLLLGTPIPAIAQGQHAVEPQAQELRSYNIPAGSLAPALRNLASSANVLLTFTAEQTERKTTAGLKGHYSLENAFATLLDGTGLEAVRTDGGGFVLRTRIVSAAASKGKLKTVVITAERDIAQRAERAPATTKSTVPLIETPISVQTVPKALIDDLQANSLREASQTVSGVYAGSTSVHEDIIVRGYQIRDSYRNGVRTRRLGMTEVANAERIDILKGPSSVAFGRGDVGGVFNVVTKKPQESAYYSIQQQAGSDSFLQTQVDATGPVNESNSVLYRVNGAYENADSFREFVQTERAFIAPSLSYLPSADTRINVEFEFANQDSPIDRGIVAVGNRPAKVPPGRNLGEKADHHENKVSLAAVDWSHRLNENWMLRQNFLHENGEGQGVEHLHTLIGDEGTLYRVGRRIEQRDIDSTYTSFELVGQADWLGLKHEPLLGVDYYDTEGQFDFRMPDYIDLDGDGVLDIPAGTLLNIYEPIYGQTEPDTSLQDTTFNSSRNNAIYIQDQISLTSHWRLLVGGRYDKAKSHLESPIGSAAVTTNDKEFSSRIGVAWLSESNWSWYSNFTESFSDTNYGLSASGKSFSPTRGEQFEIGFKAESTDKGLFTTIALYELRKSNLQTPDANNPGFSVETGGSRSRGLEWDLGGRLTSHLNLTASYAYTKTEVTEANDDSFGKALYGVPRNGAKVFLRYDQENGGATGYSLGLGAYALSEQQGDVANSFQIPGYVRADLMAQYKWLWADAILTAQLNLTNISDTGYYVASGSRDEIAPGRPRTLLASLRIEY